MPPRKKSTSTGTKRKASSSASSSKSKKKKEDSDDETQPQLEDETKVVATENQKFVEMYLKVEADEKKKNTIVFIQRKRKEVSKAAADDTENQFTYDAHGHDAWFVDRHFCKTGYFKLFTYKGVIDRNHPYITEDGKKYNGLPFITLKQSHFHQYVRGLLLQHGKRVEVWSEDKYECLKSASPGNLQEFEDLLETDSQTGVVCAIYIKKENNERKIGLAFANTTLRTIGFCSFTDSDQLANLDSTLSQIETKEAIVFYQKNDPDSERLKDVLRRSNILETERKKSDFVKKSTLEADICRLTNEERVMNLEFTEDHVANATQALLDYLELLDDINNYSHYKTKSQQISLFMKLDSTCVSSLNILPPPNDRSKNTSLFGLLNQCVTKPGSRLLREWIRQPLTSHEEIEKRLDMVQIFSEENELREEIKEILKKVPDLDRILIKVVKQRVTIEDIVKLYICVNQVPALKEVMDNNRNEKSFVKDNNLYMDLRVHLDSNYADLQSFMQMVISTIDMEAASDKNEYRINCQIDTELAKLMNDLNEVIKQCDEECQSVENDLSVSDLSLEISKKSVCFKLKKAQASALSNSTGYIQLSQSKASELKFTNETLKELGKSYIDILEQYESKSQETLQKIREVVTTFAPAFTQLRETLASIDIFISFASVSVNAAIPYTRPIIRPLDYEEEEIILYDCRHPVVEIQDSVDFKENTCILDRSQHQLHLITGPNMGGKSTFIRQVAINVIMAQIGCFIPAREGSIVTIRDAILSRVGASDSTQRGISTFMAEMLETAALLSTATSKSLIIVDELGRGTSTYDGFGLAYAIIEHLMEYTNAFTLFATHFHELRALIERFTSICNERMDSKIIDNKLVMLYQIVKDDEMAITENSNSFGIEVAKLADFPIDVIRVAESKAEEIKQLMNTTQPPSEPSTIEVADSQRRAKIHSALAKFYNFNFEGRTLQDISMNQSVLAMKKGPRSEVGKGAQSLIQSSASTSLTAIEQEKKSTVNSALTTLTDTLVSLQDRRQTKGWKSFVLDLVLNLYLIYCSILIPTIGDYNWGDYGAWVFEILNYPITLAVFRLPYIAAVVIMFVSFVVNLLFFGYYFMFGRKAIESANPSTEKIRPVIIIWAKVLLYTSMFASFVISSFVDCSDNLMVDHAQVFRTLTRYSSEKCYGTTNIIFMVFGLLNMLTLCGIISFSALTSNECNPTSTLLFTSDNTFYKVPLIVSNSIQLVIPYFIPSSLMFVRGVFHLVFSALYIPILFVETPFFSRVNNSIFAGIACARVGSSLGAIISSSVNTTSAWDLGLGMSGVCLALIAICFVIGFVVMEVYTRVVCHTVRSNFFARMNNDEHAGHEEMDAMEKEAISLLQYFEANNDLRKLNMFLRFAFKAKKKADEYDDITLAISFTKGIAANKMFVNPQLIMTCSMIYSYYCQGQPNNIIYANLLLTRGLKQRPSFITRLKLRQRVKDLDSANTKDSESIVKAEHKNVIEKLEKQQKRLYALHKQFWKELIAQNTDLIKIETINRCIAELTEKSNEIFVNLLSTRSGKNDKNLLRMYGKFLEELCFNKDQAEELFAEAANIEEDESRRKQRIARKQDNNGIRASKNKIVPLPTNMNSSMSMAGSRTSISMSQEQFQRDLGAEETLEDIENMLGTAIDDVKKKNSMINIALSNPTSNLILKVFYVVLIIIGVGLLVSSIVLETQLVGNTIAYVPLVDTVCLPAVAALNGLNKLRMRQMYFTRNDPSVAFDIAKATGFWVDTRKILTNMRSTVISEQLTKQIYTEFSKPVYQLIYPKLLENTTNFIVPTTVNSSIIDITNAELENFDRQWDKKDKTLTETNTFSFMFVWLNGLTASTSYQTFCNTLINSVGDASVSSQDLFLKYFAVAIATYFSLCVLFFIFSFIRLGLLERAIRMYSKFIPKDISGKVFHDLSKKVEDDGFGSLPSKFSNPKYIISASSIILTVICCIALVVAYLDLKNQANTILQNMYNIRDGIGLMTTLQLMEFSIRETFLYTTFSKYNVSITPPYLLSNSDVVMVSKLVDNLYPSFYTNWNRFFYGDTSLGVDPLVGSYPEIDAILKGTNCSESILANITSCVDYIGLSADVSAHMVNMKRFNDYLKIYTEPVSYTNLVALTRKTQSITLYIVQICEIIIANTVYDLTLILIYTVFAAVVTIILAYVIHNTVLSYESNQKQLRMMLNYIPEDQIESTHELKAFVLNHQLPNVFNRFAKKKVTDDSTSKLTGILDSAVDGVCLCKQSNDDFSLEYINPSAQRMFGVQANEVAGASLYSLFDTNEAKKVAKSIDFLLSTNSAAQKGETIEVECMRKNGSSFSSKLNIFVTSFNGKPVISCFIKDVTPEKKQNALLAEEKKKSEALLRNIMPDAVASRLKTGETFIAEKFNDVSVFFSDMVGFTKISSNMQANELVLMLNAIVNEFDALTDKYHLEKVKTIGDAYFCVGGLHNETSDHPERMLRFSIDTLTVIRNYNKGLFAACMNVNDIESTAQINIRIGINTGPVIAGVIGTKKFAYDFWGDTINTASRMESNSKPGRIQLSRSSYERVHDLGLEFEERNLDVKGKGMCSTYLLKDNHHEKGLLSKEDLMEIVRENVLRNEGGFNEDDNSEGGAVSDEDDLEIEETSPRPKDE